MGKPFDHDVLRARLIVAMRGTAPSAWNKAVPAPPMMPPPAKVWSELLMPREYPLAFFEMSFLLPHFLREGRGKLAMYFTRVYNPVWTNPDGMSWIEMLTDEARVERHACLTPIWSETAWFADYILPMGLGTERHDTMSQETHAAQWLGFRQPVLRVAREKLGTARNRHGLEAKLIGEMDAHFRLKDKLGTRALASSEVEFDGTWGRLVGEPGRGVPTIIEMVNHTRLDCIIGSASLMRQAVAQAMMSPGRPRNRSPSRIGLSTKRYDSSARMAV